MPRLICLAVLGTMLATGGLGQTTFATLTGAVTDPTAIAATLAALFGVRR